MGSVRPKYRCWNTFVVGAVFCAMLFGGAFPSMGLCLCEDCSCPANVSTRQKANADSSARQGTCCQKENTGDKHQPRCDSGSVGQCRCADGAGPRIQAVRFSNHQQRDNVKKSFDGFVWSVVGAVSPLKENVVNAVPSQYAPHILLPRLHLLLSIFLN